VIATYRCIADCYVPPGGYCFAGQILADDGTPGAIPIPVGWQPGTGYVDPISSDAISNYWNVGPRGQDAEPNKWSYPHGWARWSNVAYSAAVHYWVPIGGGQFLVKGAENLGPKAPTA